MTARSIFSITSGGNSVKGASALMAGSGPSISAEEPCVQVANGEGRPESTSGGSTSCNRSPHSPRPGDELPRYFIAIVPLGMNETATVEVLLHAALAVPANLACGALQIAPANTLEVARG